MALLWPHSTPTLSPFYPTPTGKAKNTKKRPISPCPIDNVPLIASHLNLTERFPRSLPSSAHPVWD